MIVLDTHVLHWAAVNDARLGPRTRRLIRATPLADRLLSCASLWEFSIHIRRGRLIPATPLTIVGLRQLFSRRYVEVPIDGDIVLATDQMVDFHGDPMDRIIAATAIVTGATLLTSDRKILAWKGSLARLDAQL